MIEPHVASGAVAPVLTDYPPPDAGLYVVRPPGDLPPLRAANSGAWAPMARAARRRDSGSFRLSVGLLDLYPPSFLQRHRAEMLQNFADLEDAAASKTALWLLIGKDLAMSLMSDFF